ncbi:MAG: tetratricopeptide repeat protein [Bacteroidales bacterium]|nr:tetratricopeptide repeat protein [Bacteroidales bacterium]
MSKQKEILQRGDEKLEAVEEVLSKTERFIEQNQKVITIIVGALIVVILGYFGLNKYYFQPREREAQNQIFPAQKYFEQDSLNLALFGHGDNPGFIEIASHYGSTKAGNLAKYYAGLSFLKQGNYQEAINYLKKFNGKDQIIAPLAIGAMADAYVELNDFSQASSLYLKAASKSKNEFTRPYLLFKAGRAFELSKNYKKALEAYETIKKEFPNTTEGRTIDKYIEKAKGKV